MSGPAKLTDITARMHAAWNGVEAARELKRQADAAEAAALQQYRSAEIDLAAWLVMNVQEGQMDIKELREADAALVNAIAEIARTGER